MSSTNIAFHVDKTDHSSCAAFLPCAQPMSPKTLHRYLGLLVILSLAVIGANAWNAAHVPSQHRIEASLY